MSHVKYVLSQRFFMGIFDSMLAKYGAVMIGYTVVGLPVFGPNSAAYLEATKNDPSRITKDYVRNSSLLINLSKAIGRIVVSYKDVQNLAGYTTLIHELDEVLDDLDNGKYRRSVVKGEEGKEGVVEEMKLNDYSDQTNILKSDNVRFEDIPIISPNGDVMVEKMSFEIKPGMHLMIAGPNGCGKSAMFRIMGQLWPVTGGKLHKPSLDKIFYIPQRPYLPCGTLRDQLIYPHTPEQMKQWGVTDDDLFEILENVRLAYLPDREGGWGKIAEWNDILSGGEKQRMALGRMLYHRP
jgi:ATP-binding cassette subfamily D (ALD) protein 3